MSARIVPDLDEAAYHAHPALSSSGAKLLDRTCPAVFRHEQDHRRPEKRVFDFGHLAHRLILGVGATIRVLDFSDYRSKAAQQARDAAYAAGEVPVLRAELLQASRMARAIRRHPIASRLFAEGVAEQSVFWVDDTWGVERRARFDWLTTINGRVVIVDYKTSTTADPEQLGRKFADLRYQMQDDFYREAAVAVGIDDPGFLFVVQMKEPPYLVTVVELDALAKRDGHTRNQRALDTYTRCLETGEWPAYTTGIELIGLPAWATRDLEWEPA